MINKKLLYLFTGYITGTIIGLLYSTKKGHEIRHDMEEGKKHGDHKDKKILFDYLVHIHKNIFDEIVKEPRIQGVKKNLGSYRETLQKMFHTSQGEIINIVKQHTSLSENDMRLMSDKIQTFFTSKIEDGMEQMKKTFQSISKDNEPTSNSPKPSKIVSKKSRVSKKKI